MKRTFVPLYAVLAHGRERGIDGGICACVDVENMGYCKDGVSRWYHFDLDGKPCYTIKHGGRQL